MVGFGSLEHIAATFGPQQGVSVGRWFGLGCLKVEGRVFAALSGEGMAFKLPEPARSRALEIEGAHLFDPRRTGHPMKEWVQIPADRADTWQSYGVAARDYVAGAPEAKKEAVIAGLVDARRRILVAAESLSPEKRDRVFLGEWSTKDLLAHLIGWDYTNQEAVQEILAGRKPKFWNHYDRDWQSYNAALIAKHKQDDWKELIAAVQESHRQLIDCLRNVPADDYLRHRKIVSLLQAETRDEETHHRQIARFGETPG